MRPPSDSMHATSQPGFGFRLVCLSLMVLSLMLPITAPVSAQANQTGERIEICSEFGVLEIRIDAEGNEIPPGEAPCETCRDCPLCMISPPFDLPGEIALPGAIGTLPQHTAAEHAIHAENPAQFWADNRGPPIPAKKAKTLATKNFMGPTRSKGRAPWT